MMSITKKQAEILKHYRDGSPSNASTRVHDNVLTRQLIVWEGSVFEGTFKLTQKGHDALNHFEGNQS